jgi:Tat protein secretion system quality control protein TatD with DNase activity
MAPVRPVLPRLLCSNETVGTCALTVPVRPVLHQFSGSNEMVRNTLKHDFWIQWSGSGAFVAKNSDATLFSELVR